MCLSSQGSLRSCLPPLLGWTLGKVLIQTTCSAFSCHSTSCDLQLLLLMVELWFWGTPQHLWGQSCTWKYISGFPDKISFIVPACALFQYPPPFLCYVCVLGGNVTCIQRAQAMHHWHFISAWLPCFRTDPFPLAAARYYLSRFMRRCPVPGVWRQTPRGPRNNEGGPLITRSQTFVPNLDCGDLQ